MLIVNWTVACVWQWTAGGPAGQRGNRVKVTAMCVNVGQGHVPARSHSSPAGSARVIACKSTAVHQVRQSNAFNTRRAWKRGCLLLTVNCTRHYSTRATELAPQSRWRSGYCFKWCLSVCMSVCLSVCAKTDKLLIINQWMCIGES